MTHSCNHQHGHSSSADKWTWTTAFVGGLTHYVSNAVWLASLSDLTTGQKGTGKLTVSWSGLAFGLATSALITAGEGYAHYCLNKAHQTSHRNEHLTHDEESRHPTEKGENTPLINPAPEKKLTRLEKLALLGDLIAHVGEVAGIMTFIARLFYAGSMSRATEAYVNGGATLLGSLASIAPVRTCYNAMLKSKS